MNYRIINHRIEVEDPNDGKYCDFCQELAVTCVIVSLLNKNWVARVKVYTDLEPVIVEFPCEKINRTLLPTLIGYGLTIIDTPTHAEIIMQILMEGVENATCVYQHDALGFRMIDNELVFLAHKPIGCTNTKKAQSEFKRPEITAPKHDFASWKKFVEAEVIGHKCMELALTLGAAAPVAHLLREAKVLTLVPIWALIGESSTGKTTALKLMASIWGSPSIIANLNATQNAFYGQLSDKYGLPALIDETSSMPDWDFTKVLYHLPEGRSKLRCDSSGKVVDPYFYSGAIVFTGERSLFEQTNGNTGLVARLIEFQLPWTDDANHAQRLNTGCGEYYGTAVYPLMEWLLRNKEKLPGWYRDLYEKIKSKFSELSGVEDRLIKTYTLILLTACVLRSALGLNIKKKAMIKTLIDLHYSNPRIAQRTDMLYERLKFQILQNRSKFPTGEGAPYASAVWGERGLYQGRNVVWIHEHIFEKFLRDAGMSDSKTARQQLFNDGRLVRTKDRHYGIPHKLGGIQVKCFGLFVDADFGNRTRSVSSYAMVKNLLEEEEDDDQ